MKSLNPFLKPKKLKISERIKLFLDYSLDAEAFWDLCCDHGHAGLGILVFKKNASHVTFVDCVPHIMNLLQMRIDQLLVKPKIPFTLLCLDAGAIEMDVKGVVLIAGVGGLTISNIIKSLLEQERLKAKRLILSPHTDIKVLEEYFKNDRFMKSYDLHETNKVIVGKKEKPLYIFNIIGENV